MIVYKLLDDGGFVCGDTETRLTSYAYPTSTYAGTAKRNPLVVAEKMVQRERRYGGKFEAFYDAQNWVKLEG
jgi:hypothetical protein